MRALVFDRFGEPHDVVQLRQIPDADPGRGQVRVRMIASPINPSDLLVIRGQYGRLPSLPATPGFEGVGVVESAGPGLLARLRMGKRVAVLNRDGGNWQERVIISARLVVPVPARISDEQAASFFVNPATAVVLTRNVLRVPVGSWLLQSAGASSVGKMIIRLGRAARFRTVSIVRRREQAQQLRALGGDEVVCTEHESVEERVQQITGGAGVPFALDAVGGPVASAMLRSLAEGGRMVVYGTLSGEPIAVDGRILMVAHRRVEGFWLSNWVRQQNPLTMLRLFRHVGQLIEAGILTSDVAKTYPMTEFAKAVEEAEKPGRGGKVLLRLDRA